jgi:hypothetical protein
MVFFGVIKLLFLLDQRKAIEAIENECLLALKPLLRGGTKSLGSLHNPVHDVLLSLIAQQLGDGFQDEFGLLVSELLAIDGLEVAESHALLGILYSVQRPCSSLLDEGLKFSYRFLNRKDWVPIIDED